MSAEVPSFIDTKFTTKAAYDKWVKNGLCFTSDVQLDPVPDIPLTEYVLQNAQTFGEKECLIDGPSGRKLTYEQLPTSAQIPARIVCRLSTQDRSLCPSCSLSLPLSLALSLSPSLPPSLSLSLSHESTRFESL
jgi:hypothetical protein